jgi:endonuclease/exonuclease/phosphatase family metal-dependent hydrolase
MFDVVGPTFRRSVGAFALFVAGSLLFGGTAAAQTIVLNQQGQVTDTTIRGGAYANTNYDGDPLITRRSDADQDWVRRTLLKFDTENTIPEGTQIASATLTLTVKSGLGSAGQTRPLQVLRIPNGWLESDATWVRRMGSSRWTTAGGDTSGQFATANATNVTGGKVTINVTSLVQRTVNGEFDTRYTRMMIVDAGADAKESYREYYPSEDGTASRRPTLTIVLGTGTNPPATPPPTSPSTSNTIKYLQWNIAQGYDPAGRSNIDRIVAFIVAKRPDVISFNEIMKYSSTSSHCQQIADRLRAQTGETWTYHWIQKSGASTGEGEAVMTRLDVDATDDFLLSVARSVAMLRVNVNGRIVNVFSTHLDHQSSSTRVTQVRQLVSWMATHAEQRIVAGDFNGWPGTAEYNEMNRSHNDGWAVARNAGVAYSFAGNPDGNTRNTRIDYVWGSRGATALAVTRAEVYDTRDSGGVKISDHNPLIVTYRVN